MAAYLISEVHVLDEELGQRYRDLAACSIEQPWWKLSHARAGSRELSKATGFKAANSSWWVPNVAGLRAWYDSADNSAARRVASEALTRRVLFVEGP